VQFRQATYRAAARAEYWLGRVDEIAERMPRRRNLVRAAQLREASAVFDDGGVFVAFPEIVAMDLLDISVEPAVDPRISRLCQVHDDAVERVVRGEPIGHVLLGRSARILADLEVDDLGHDILERIPWRPGLAWLGGPRPEDAFVLCAPHGPELRAVVAELLTWLEADSDLPVVVRQALAHYQFAVTGPVAHGEHLASLLIVLGFIQAGALRDEILAPALWFSPQNEQYRRQFRQVLDTGDFDAWVTFFAGGIIEICKSQIELVHMLEEIRDKQLNTFTRSDGLARLVNALSGSPVFSTELAAKLSGVSLRQAHAIVQRLDKAGVVRKWDRNRQIRRRGQQVIREVPEVVKAIGMFDHLPYRRDKSVLDPPQSDPAPQ
jgi:hypothetical protein